LEFNWLLIGGLFEDYMIVWLVIWAVLVLLSLGGRNSLRIFGWGCKGGVCSGIRVRRISDIRYRDGSVDR
jgi:hypothetical protein